MRICQSSQYFYCSLPQTIPIFSSHIYHTENMDTMCGIFYAQLFTELAGIRMYDPLTASSTGPSSIQNVYVYVLLYV